MSIDSTLLEIINKKRKEVAAAASISDAGGNSTGVTINSIWSQHFDPTTKMNYYYNSKTQVSQWEKPDDYKDGLVESISSNAILNSKSGQILMGSQTHFEKQGRAADREGRQLGAFFDMSVFDQNRADAVDKKRKLQESDIDWKKYKEDKKKRNFRLKNSWLYEED
jgi:hypothetical protein